jgi:hypothetical protein
MNTAGKEREKLWRASVNEIETDSKKKNIRDMHRGITLFRKSYQPGPNLVKDQIPHCSYNSV